ncbi:MAG: class I SAM-dependent methyltransferase [Burkholderiales bacterium]|nr:class I SAM-dependent methyltransferase [Burkholderiales bacterium]
MAVLKALRTFLDPKLRSPTIEATGRYVCGDRVSVSLSVLEFEAKPRVSGNARLRLSMCNDGRRQWPTATLVLRWSVLNDDCTDLVLTHQKVFDLPSLKPGKTKLLAATVDVPVNSVADVDVTFQLVDVQGVHWQPVDLPARLRRHVSGQDAKDAPQEFDYETMYKTVDLEKDWWTPVGPATRAEYESLGRGKCAQLMALGLGPSSRVLDIGCGTGQLTEALVPILSAEGYYYGTDVAGPAVEFCRKKFPQPRFHFVKNEQTSIPIHGIEFDFVYLGSVFTHMFPREIALMLRDIRRLMSASGCVVADAFVSREIADFVGNRAMIQLNEGNLLAACRSRGFEVEELSSTNWNEQCRRVIYRLTARAASSAVTQDLLDSVVSESDLADTNDQSIDERETAVYADARNVTSLDDCYFYHTMDLPDVGVVHGNWDLRPNIETYLGNVSFAGKRVLDVGCASGALSFHMERRGARVISFDLDSRGDWDMVPFEKWEHLEHISHARKAIIDRLNNGYWFAHRSLSSRARVVYGSVYAIPEAIGLVDIVVFGSILLHLRDPFLALQNGCRLATQTVIVSEALRGPAESASEPILGFLPDAKTLEPKDTWWDIKPEWVVRAVGVLGFEETTLILHKQVYEGREVDQYTVVGTRTHTKHANNAGESSTS